MLVAPLALARLIEAARDGRFLLVVGYGAVLIVQLAALVATASRGPLIGLAAGAVVFALGWSASGGRRAAGVSALVMALAGLSFLVALNLPGGPLEPLRGAPVIGRFAQIGQTATGSQADTSAHLVGGRPPARGRARPPGDRPWP